MADPLQLFQAGAQRAAQFRQMALNLQGQSALQRQRVGEQKSLMQEESALQQKSPLFQAQIKNLESSIRSRDANIEIAQKELGLSKQAAIDFERRHREVLQNNLIKAQIIAGGQLRDDDQRILNTAKSNFNNSIQQLTSELSSSFYHSGVNPLLIDTIARKIWNGVPLSELTPEERQVLTFRDVADRIDGMIKVRDDATNSLSVVQQARQPQPTGLPRPPSFIQPPQPANTTATDEELDKEFGGVRAETGGQSFIELGRTPQGNPSLRIGRDIKPDIKRAAIKIKDVIKSIGLDDLKQLLLDLDLAEIKEK